MTCVICDCSTNRNVKGISVCSECIKKCQEVREHLNLTRRNPQSKLNSAGETPVTLREVVLRAVTEKGNKNNETT